MNMRLLLWPSPSRLSNFTDLWWIFISLFGIQILFLQRTSPACIPLGISLAILGIFTLYVKPITTKASGAMLISIILLASMSGVFQSTQTIFAFYVTVTILLSYATRLVSVEMIGACLCAIAGICDIFAGLNKLVPSSPFYRGETLDWVLEKNLFPEPSFLVDFLIQSSPIVALLEVVCGFLILIFPLTGLIFAIFLHFPIAIFTAYSLKHLLALLSYAAMLYYVLSAQFVFAYPRRPRAAAGLVLSNLSHSLSQLSISRGWRTIHVNSFTALVAFQVALPTVLLGVRLITGRIYGYGFGWQMFS